MTKQRKHERSMQRQNDSVRDPSASSYNSSYLRWLFLLLIALSILSVWAISTRVSTSPHLKTEIGRVHQSTVLLSEALSFSTNKLVPSPASRDDTEALQATDRLVNATVESASTEELSTMTGIPHLIHQSWKNIDKIPTRFHPWMRSWVEMHPSWTYVFWTDDDNLAIFQQLYPQYLNVAMSVGKIGLADMARYALLHRVGGLYVDIDFESMKPFDALHRDHTLFLSSEPRAHAVLLEKSNTPALCNALMASRPGHPFWLRVLDSIKEKFEREGNRGDTVALTGPRIVKQTYLSLSNNSDIVVFPSEYFYPEVAYWNLDTMKKACRSRKDADAKDACAWLHKFPHGEFTDKTYATHHWQCTWCIGDRSKEYASLSAILPSVDIFRPQISSLSLEFNLYSPLVQRVVE